MTGLAADIHLLPGGVVAVGFLRVVPDEIGGMAGGAARVPVLECAGPVQRIVMRDLLLRMQVVPALTALSRRPAVPGDAEGLHAAIGELNEVLLQRRPAEGVGDAEGL